MPDAGRTGDPTETLEMDWSHSPQVSRQHYTKSLDLEKRGRLRNARRRDLETDVKEAGDSWRDWLGTGISGEIMLAVYASGGATKALLD